MRNHSILLLAVLTGSLHAQDAAAPRVIGGFETQGSLTTGYRFSDVKGYRPKFQELVNLGEGFRMTDFSLFGHAQDGKNRFADEYSLTMSGIGGDPYTTSQFTLRKNRVYDLRANFRQSRYYWDQNDRALQPSGLNALTSNHDWATVRKLGSINLLVHATDKLRFNFEYYRNTRSGASFTTRTPDYFGSPSTWGTFARANPYYLFAPVDESANRATVGMDYSPKNWTLHYRFGYQSFMNSIDGQNLGSPSRSLNVDDRSTAAEILTSFSWKDYRELHTPVSEFSYTGKIIPRLETRGGYIFYRYSGPASLAMAFQGTARAPTGAYNVALTTKADVSEPNHVVDQGLTYKINDWWSTMLDYRYSRFTVDSSAEFNTTTTTGIVSGHAFNEWRISTHTADLNMAFTPASSLLIRAGMRYLNNDIRMLQDGIIDTGRTRNINTVWPIGSLYFQPNKVLTVRADVESVTNGTSYTRVTPHTDIGGRFVVRIRPTDKFYIEDSAVVRNRKLLDTDFRSTIRSNAFTATYELNEKLSGFAGFSYDSFFAANFVSFLRGTAPFTNLALRDQSISRVWTGGLRINPVKRLGLSVSGNYVRTTGVGEITGEKPIFGPMSFPYATGSAYYDFPRLGRLTVQLQRTYYIEQIVPGNNSSANLISILWTRSF